MNDRLSSRAGGFLDYYNRVPGVSACGLACSDPWTPCPTRITVIHEMSYTKEHFPFFIAFKITPS